MTLAHARRSLGMALLITRREVRDQFRDWRILAPIILLTLFFPLLMNFTAGQAVAFVAQYGADVVGERLIPFLLMIVGFFPISISLVIALESFVGEKERHSLEPLLSSPLTDVELYVGKTLAAMLPPLLAAYLGIAVYLIGLAVSIQWYPNPILLIQILALTTIQALVMVAGAVVISAQTTSVRAANLLASFIIIPMALLVQGESLIMFWAQYGALWWVIFGLAVITLILVRIGVQLFNREELLGRDLDELNLKAGWRTFARAFVGAGRGRGVGGWLRLEVWPALRRLRLPALLVSAVLLAAVLLGYRYAALYQLPLAAAGLGDVAANFDNNLAQLGFVSVGGAAWVFFTNLRALALATLLGLFSFGVLGVVLLMAPLALTGYFAGQVALIGLSPLQFFLAFILPHGLFEITAAALTGAAILRLGGTLLAPPADRTLTHNFLAALADWAKVALAVVVPLLLVAALAEVFLTPLAVRLVLGG
ncbi:MAG: stage II sporulation protein M [Anaerolineales bacterium]|nr:stage II sporulation protein M [Anaerolineales bacterium]